MAEIITIDGSQGEGGGQILRTSLSLAAVTGQAVRINNIRAGRSKPGLAAQHTTACRAVAAVCGAHLEGDNLGSPEVCLHPRELPGGEYLFDVAAVRPSAGSVTLVLQSVLPPLLFAASPSQVTIRGGTDVPWSPVYSYLVEVFLPLLRSVGVRVELSLKRAGWYPAGGGEIVAQVKPLTGKLAAFTLLERGPLAALVCHSVVSDRLPEHILSRQCQGAREALAASGTGLTCYQERLPAHSPGTTCLVAARFERGAAGFSALGERGKRAEQVGAEAGAAMADFLAGAATVDAHLADQLLLYAALAEGQSGFVCPKLTAHLETNALVIRQLLQVGAQFTSNVGGGTAANLTGLGLAPARV